MADIVIRAAREIDLDAVCAIEDASFSDPWSRASFEASFADEHTRFSVAEAGGEVVGYLIMWSLFDEAEVLSVAVMPEMRRGGIGRMMMSDALGYALSAGVESVYLEVRETNEAAKRMYGSFDFEAIGRRKRYYVKPVEDAIIMRLEVRSAAPAPAKETF